MIHKSKNLLVITVLLLSINSFCQQDPLFSQYMFNKLAVNPACAGSREILTADLCSRWQWIGIDGAPSTMIASLHSQLRNPHLGLGATVYQDVTGPSVYQGALGTFSYKLILPAGRLAFGLQAGIKYSNTDLESLDPQDESDPLITNQIRKRLVPDANFGIYYYSKKAYIGVSSKQLLQNEIMVSTVNGKNQVTHLMRHFYAIAGTYLPLNEVVVFRPSFLIKYVQNAPPQLDLNASFVINNMFWVGASYRTQKAVSLMTEIGITDEIRLGYSYDIWFNELKGYNKGSHEIRLGFDLSKPSSRMRTPRFF